MSVFGNTDLFAEFDNPLNNDDDYDEISDSCDWDELNQCQEENVKLKAENEDLKKLVRILTQPRNVFLQNSTTDGPIAQLLLFNNTIARHERESLEKLLQHYIARDRPSRIEFAQPQKNALQLPKSESIPPCNQSAEVDKAFVVTNSIQFYSNGFCLDHLGDPVMKSERLILKVPQYQRICDVLNGQEQTEEKKEVKMARTCFNCGEENHQLKDCPIPKNYKAINERKQKFLNHVANSPQAGSVRYHDDDNADDLRFSKFKPGFISQELRKALGIIDRELPPYIYQMRMLGYPPGHLEEARVSGSGLSFFKGMDSDVDKDSDLEKGPLDVDKFISFPGFNIDPDEHTIDKSGELGFPPMDPRHSLNVLISYHKHRNSLLMKRKADQEEEEVRSRKRPKQNHVTRIANDDVREVDMETSDVEDNDARSHTEETSSDKAIVSNDVINGSSNGTIPPPDASEEDRSNKEGAKIDVPVDEGSSPDCQMEEGEVVSTSSSYDVIIEEQALIDGVDAGDLDEEELQLRREEILRQLESNDFPSDTEVLSSQIEVKITNEDDSTSHHCSTTSLCSNPDAGQGSTTPLSASAEVSTSLVDESSPSNKMVFSQDALNKTNDSLSNTPTNKNQDLSANPLQEALTTFSQYSPPQRNDAVSPESPLNCHEDSDLLPPQSPKYSPYERIDVTSPESPQAVDITYPESPQAADIISPQATGDISPASPQATGDISPASLQATDVISPASPQATGDISPASPQATGDISPASPQATGDISPASPQATMVVSTDSTLSEKTPIITSQSFNQIAPESNDNFSPQSPPPVTMETSSASPSVHHSLDASSTPGIVLDMSVDSDRHDSSAPSMEESIDNSDSQASPNLPHRSKFARGITQFDDYFKESKSSGVFGKLKNILKASPRNRSKNT